MIRRVDLRRLRWWLYVSLATVSLSAACSNSRTEATSSPAPSTTQTTADPTTLPPSTTNPLQDDLERSGADRLFSWKDATVEVGETVLARLNPHCGFNHLPKIGGNQWEAPELGTETYGAIPPEWEPQLYDEEPGDDEPWLRVTIERTTETELIVTALNTDRTVTYQPAVNDFFCD